MSPTWHVSISHPPAERAAAMRLAERLLGVGIAVALDDWSLASREGSHERSAGAWSEALLVSRAAFDERWHAELARRLLGGAVAGRRRLVPVLLEDLGEVPAALRSRPSVDASTDPTFASTAWLWRLVAMLRGERGDSPPPSDWPATLAPLAGQAVIAAVDLRLTADRIIATLDGREVEHVFSADALATLESATHAGGLDRTALAPVLLGGAVGACVRDAVRAERERAGSVELRFEVAHRPWQPFDWESALASALGVSSGAQGVAGSPWLRIARVQPSCAVALPAARGGPLELLVILASPDSRHGSGTRVDVERASRALLAAVEPACAGGLVRVTLRDRAVANEIRATVAERPPHVVLLVAAMRQGELALARPDDREERMVPSRWVAEALGGPSAVPLLIVANAPLKDAVTPPRDLALEAARVGYELVAAGLPAVLALSDVEGHAALVSRLLAHASADANDSLRDVFARARAVGDASSDASESLAPPTALFLTTPLVRPVLASGGRAEDGSTTAPQPPRVGVLGRRGELRALRKVLQATDRSGLWITGAAGVGKTTLAAALVEAHDDAPRLAVTLTGRVVPEDIVEEVGRRIRAQLRVSYEREDPEADGREPLRVLAEYLCRADVPWRERWERLTRETAGRLAIVIVLDAFEENQDDDGRIIDGSLRELLEVWPREAGAPRSVVASRRPLARDELRPAHLETVLLEPLPADAASWMRIGTEHAVALPRELAERFAAACGGVPRRLQLLESVLASGGTSALADVLASDHADLVPSSIARLIAGLASPSARTLLRRACVHRVAVDRLGLAWLIGRERDQHHDAAVAERLARFDEAIRAARVRGEEPSVESLGLSRDDQRVLEQDIASRLRPPIEPPEGLDEALDELVAAGLLERRGEAEGSRFVVPRWLVPHLDATAEPGERVLAHQRAARYRHWRVRTLPRPAHADLADLVELRRHLLAADELQQAARIAEVVVTQLDALGALERAERLCHEVLGQLPRDSAAARAFRHQLGICARRRGRISEARTFFHEAATREDAHRDGPGLARSWGELGVVAALDGDLAAAQAWFEKSLALAVEAGDEDAEATNLHHLAVLARHAGDLASASSRIERALAIREARASDPELLGVLLTAGELLRARQRFDDSAAASSRALVLARARGDTARAHRAWLALARTARERDQPEEAARHLGAALEAAAARGDRAHVSEAAAELGRLAEVRGEPDEAWRAFRRALESSERDGDREGMIAAYLDLARLDRRRGHAIDALGWAVHAVAAALTIGSARTAEALDALTELARNAGSRKRWRSSWKRAYDVEPPPEVVAWVEAPWWRRVARRREIRAREEARG
ncbi:MAG: tetratricopeptide repeat protein [bacterium]